MDERTWQEIRAERMAERRQREASQTRAVQHAKDLAGIRALGKRFGVNVLKGTGKPMPTETRLDNNEYLRRRNAELDKQKAYISLHHIYCDCARCKEVQEKKKHEALHIQHGLSGSLVR